jgi:phosphoribosylanthranilate isomerase
MKLIDSSGKYGDFAFHLCGKYAEMVHCYGWTELDDIVDFRRVGRVQVNHGRMDAEAIVNCWQFGKHIERPVIMQHSSALPFRAVPISMLQDQSGGKGLKSSAWVEPSVLSRKAGSPIGYAGGLGPDNIAVELPKIIAAAKGQRFWIDCESSLRDENDWFDTSKAEAMIRGVHAAAPGMFQELRL